MAFPPPGDGKVAEFDRVTRHARIVSGVTMVAIWRKTFRPSGFPLAASRRRWSSVKRRRLPPDSSRSFRTRLFDYVGDRRRLLATNPAGKRG
jgi:hypothetical protein